MDVKFSADTKMADSKRELELQKAGFNQEINTKVRSGAFSYTRMMSDNLTLVSFSASNPLCAVLQKAESQLAYELQAAKEQQKIRLEEIEIQVVQRKKEITIEEKEIDRMEKELIATVKRPAEAEAYKIEQLAEGQKSVKNKRVFHSSLVFTDSCVSASG